MRANKYSCICGFILWLDQGVFCIPSKDGASSWIARTHCPRCQADLQDQLKEQKKILEDQLLKIQLEKEI